MKPDHVIQPFIDDHYVWRCFACRGRVLFTPAGQRAAYWRHRPTFYPAERRPSA